MAEPIVSFTGTLDNTELDIKVYGNVDKADGFVYYTFRLDEKNFGVISKFDGEEWKLANLTSDGIAQRLGSILERFIGIS